MRWIRAKHEGKNRDRYERNSVAASATRGGDSPRNGVVFTGASSVKVTRYRYRGSTIPTPWTPKPAAAATAADQRVRHVERPVR